MVNQVKIRFKHECILVGCIPPTAVAVHVGIHNRPKVWAWRPPSPQVWVWRPPWVWAWRPPWPDLSASPPGCGPGDTPPLPNARNAGIPPPRHARIPPPRYLQGMLGYHLQCMLGYHPPVNRMTDRCKNITLSQTSFAGSNKNAFQVKAASHIFSTSHLKKIPHNLIFNFISP